MPITRPRATAPAKPAAKAAAPSKPAPAKATATKPAAPPPKPAAKPAPPAAKPAPKPPVKEAIIEPTAPEHQPEMQQEETQAEQETAMVPAQQNALAAEPLPDYLAKYEDDRRGKENIAPEDTGTPRIKLLQPTSDEVQGIRKGEGKGAVNGYTAGQLYFGPLDRLLGEEMTFVVLTHDKEWVRFGDRAKNEDPGLHWKMKPDEVDKYPDRRADLEWGANRTPPAAQFTHNFLVVRYNPEEDALDTEIGPAVLSLAKTNMNCAQTLCQALLTTKGPAFIRVYKVKARQVTNAKGSFFVLDVVPAGLVQSEKTADILDDLYQRLGGKPLDVDYTGADEEVAAPAGSASGGGEAF